MFVAIDRVSKFAFAELHEKATRRIEPSPPLTDACRDRCAYRQRHRLHDARRQGSAPRTLRSQLREARISASTPSN